MIRWLDFNDTWLAAEWGHPSDNLGGILAVADYSPSRRAGQEAAHRDTRRAHRHDQGARDPGRARPGEQLQPRRARSRAAGAGRLHRGGHRACSAARRDRSSTPSRTPGSTAARCAPTGTRRTPARARAGRRAMRPAAPCAMRFSRSRARWVIPRRLSAKTWGFQDVLFKGKPLRVAAAFGSYVMENVLFKISFPAEFHAQTAVEAAMTLHLQVTARLDQIERVVIETQEPGVRIIDKTGPLANPADRDHCIQYMVAIPLHLRPPERGGLRGRRRRAIRASTRCAPRCR